MQVDFIFSPNKITHVGQGDGNFHLFFQLLLVTSNLSSIYFWPSEIPKWPPANEGGGQRWPSETLNWGKHCTCMCIDVTKFKADFKRILSFNTLLVTSWDETFP